MLRQRHRIAARVGEMLVCAALVTALSSCDAPPRPLHLSTPTPRTTAERDQELLEEATHVIREETAATDRAYSGVDRSESFRLFETPALYRLVREDLKKFRSRGFTTRGASRPFGFTLLTVENSNAGDTEVRVGYCEDESATAVIGPDGRALSRGSRSPLVPLVAVLRRGSGTNSPLVLDRTFEPTDGNYC